MTGILIIAALLAFAIWIQISHRSYAFTAWVFVCVGTALCYPQSFQNWGGVKLALLIVPLIQVIMFGMGTTLHFRDFLAIAKEPWPVGVGIFLQFSVMPIAGYFLAKAFRLEPELAAGVILVGACSGGLASNIMSYLAGANVPLSMAMTLVSTFIAPIMTPLAMKILAGEYLPVDFLDMTIGVFNIMIIPVLAGMAANIILFSKQPVLAKKIVVAGLTLGFAAAALVLNRIPAETFGILGTLKTCFILVLILLAAVSLTKLIVDLLLGKGSSWIEHILPVISMVGICAILAIITAQTHSVLMRVGATIVLVAILHNAIGYLLGYWGARSAGILIGRLGYHFGFYPTPDTRVDERDCRTVAFEVGMQNGGMATALAVDVLKSHVAALPPNIFGTWQNISGSLLVNFWRRHLPKDAPR